MEILVCIKRVPTVGGKIAVTADGQDVDTRMSGFAMSPHEECAVEEAIQITERLGGGVSVLTLGPPEAAEASRKLLGTSLSIFSVLFVTMGTKIRASATVSTSWVNTTSGNQIRSVAFSGAR